MTTTHPPRRDHRPGWFRAARAPLLLLALLATLVLAGCQPDEDGNGVLSGTYVDEWGTTHVITDTTWTQTYSGGGQDVFHIVRADGEADVLVARNDAANAYNAGQYSRFEWMVSGSADAYDTYYCQQVYDAATADEAAAAPGADRSDPTVGGCGAFDFAWTNLTPP